MGVLLAEAAFEPWSVRDNQALWSVLRIGRARDPLQRLGDEGDDGNEQSAP